MMPVILKDDSLHLTHLVSLQPLRNRLYFYIPFGCYELLHKMINITFSYAGCQPGYDLYLLKLQHYESNKYQTHRKP